MYTYDSANCLISVNSNTTYAYNGLGDRYTQTVNNVTTNYILDLNAGLTQILSDGTNTYTYGLGRIAQTNTTTEYFLGDALGSVRQVINNTGDITLAKSYSPYGEVTQTAGSGQSIYAYTGEQTDSNGLTYLRARYYDSNVGRFLSRDIWNGNYNSPLSLNRWNYTHSNPINYTDPTGLKPTDVNCDTINLALELFKKLRTLCKVANGDPDIVTERLTVLNAREEFFRGIVDLSAIAGNHFGDGYWYAAIMLESFLNSDSFVSVNLNANSSFTTDRGILRATKYKGSPVAEDDADEITPLLYVFLSKVKSESICGGYYVPDIFVLGDPTYKDTNEIDRSPRPAHMGWWGAFGHVTINGTYTNNYITKSSTGYSIKTTVIYRIDDTYKWGDKVSTPLPLGGIDPELGLPSMSWVSMVSIPHEWEESLRDYGYANEFDYSVTWFEQLQIEVNDSFSNFSIPQDNRYNIPLDY